LDTKLRQGDKAAEAGLGFVRQDGLGAPAGILRRRTPRPGPPDTEVFIQQRERFELARRSYGLTLQEDIQT